jgi:hypothetical protein
VYKQLHSNTLSKPQRAVAYGLLTLAVVGIGLEFAQGVSASLSTRGALIVPWIGSPVF